MPGYLAGAGQDPEARLVPGTVTVPLRSQPNASPFGIMLLLVWGRPEHGMIPTVGWRGTGERKVCWEGINT
jgi:hypothetical protein